MPENGISNEGENTTELFCSITGAIKSKRADPKGDAILEGYYVEIKKAGTEKSKSKTINQIRAVKYLPIVIYYAYSKEWFVIPPNIIVEVANNKKRGQHTENSFECCNSSVSQFNNFKCNNPNDLKQKVLDCIKEGERFPKLKEAMSNILKECQDLAIKSKNIVNNAMK